jgi:hypothetical protein
LGGRSDSVNYRAAGGGRISLHVDDMSGFAGDYSANGGASGTRIGGAGTVFIQESVDTYGRLYVDNGGNVANVCSTEIEHVGRHTIADVTDLGNGQWEIDALPSVAVRQFETIQIESGTGRHAFSIGAQQTVEIVVDDINGFTPHVMLFRDDGDLTVDDYISQATYNNMGRTALTTDLDGGAYIVVVARWYSSKTQAIAQTYLYTGDYTLSIDSGLMWQPTVERYDYGIQGLTVDLDVSDELSEYYVIDHNTRSSFTVTSAEDLSGLIGNELMGVHQLDSVSVTGGASVDFGRDRLELLEPEQSTVSQAGIINTALPSSVIAHFAQTNVDGDIHLTEAVVMDELTIQSNGLRFDDLTVTNTLAIGGAVTTIIDQLSVGNLLIDEATLVAHDVSVSGNVDVLNGATLTIPASQANPNILYNLDLQLAGRLTVDAGSVIDASGKGYPLNYNGPDFDADDKKQGCHGGENSATTDTEQCIYGRYR